MVVGGTFKGNRPTTRHPSCLSRHPAKHELTARAGVGIVQRELVGSPALGRTIARALTVVLVAAAFAMPVVGVRPVEIHQFAAPAPAPASTRMLYGWPNCMRCEEDIARTFSADEPAAPHMPQTFSCCAMFVRQQQRRSLGAV